MWAISKSHTLLTEIGNGTVTLEISFLSKVKNEPPYDLDILLLSGYQG